MKRAFTLIELVFVVIVVGILSAVLIPKFTQPTLQEAANQIISHIRYTQHLALMDDKYDPKDQNWFKKRWQIHFHKNSGEWKYSVYQDLDLSGSASTVVSHNEVAKNPTNSKQILTADSSSGKVNTAALNLTKKYHITSIQFSHSCSYSRSKMLSFDYLGRPFYGKPKSLATPLRDNLGSTGVRLMRSPCIITISNNANNKNIIVEPITGYAYISS